MFDPESFLHNEVEGQMDTKVTPVPEGEYPGVAIDVKARNINEYAVMEVTWQIDDPEFEKIIGRNPARVRQSVFLDLMENGSLDLGSGKNVQLGKLRDALNQNNPDQAWSPSAIIGNSATVLVTHRSDPKNPDNVYDQVSRVAPLY